MAKKKKTPAKRKAPAKKRAPARRKAPRRAPAKKKAVAPQPVIGVDVAARVGRLAPAPIAGGPVSLPVQRLVDLFRLAYLADDDAAFELRLELPAGKRPPKLRAREGVAAVIDGARLRVTHAESGARWYALGEARHLSEALAKAGLPDGTTFELLAAPATIERGQRWSGEVAGGQLRLRHSAPALDAATLRDALALSAATREGASLPVRSADEAKAALADSDVKLMTDGKLEHVDGALRLAEPDGSIMHFVAAPLFRARFGQRFACAPADVDDDDDDDDQLAELSAAITKKVAVQTLAGPTVHEGPSGTFHRYDLVAGRPIEAEHVAETDRQLARTGYVVVGDLVCSRVPDVVIRGYARADGEGDTWGALLCGLLESRFEYVTELGGDAWLTTGLKPAKDDLSRKLHRVGCPDLNFRKLQALHDRHKARKVTLVDQGRSRQAPRDLAALAAAIDRSLCQQFDLDPAKH